jgi:phage FluMu protein Com
MNNYTCCFCGSLIETADTCATHANCPRCGLIDTADIEPITQRSSEPSFITQPGMQSGESFDHDENGLFIGDDIARR